MDKTNLVWKFSGLRYEFFGCLEKLVVTQLGRHQMADEIIDDMRQG